MRIVRVDRMQQIDFDSFMKRIFISLIIVLIHFGCAPKKVSQINRCKESTYNACGVDYVDVRKTKKVAFKTKKPKQWESKIFEVRLRDVRLPSPASEDPCEKGLAPLTMDYLNKRLSEAEQLDLINLKRRFNFELNADIYADKKRVNDELLVGGYALANGSFDTWCDLPKAAAFQTKGGLFVTDDNF